MSKRKISRKGIIIFCVVVAVLAGGYYFWQNYKYRLANQSVKSAVASSTDSLYHITYDSIYIDELAGNAYMKNVHIVPDTSRIRRMPSEEWPAALLNITIKSISVKGINTADALKGTRIIGDTVLINHPDIVMYTLRPLSRDTKIESEVKLVYKEILGKLKRIQIDYVLIDTINVRSVKFFNAEKNFDFLNGNIQLTDVLVDSVHNEDTSRTLFSRSAAFTVDSFYSFNHNRPEFIVKKVAFSGEYKTIILEKIMLNRFDDESSEGKLLIDADALKFAGLNTNQIIKNKNLVVDTIQCGEVKFYEPPKENLEDIGSSVGKKETDEDTLAGFRNAYSLHLKYFGFQNINFIPAEKNKFDIGKIKLRLFEVDADRIGDIAKNPLRFIKEAELNIARIKLTSKDRQYNFLFDDILINSATKNLWIGEVSSSPVLNEKGFASHYAYQKDRFDVSLKGVSLRGIAMKNLFDDRLIASSLNVKQTTAKIYRDLNRPLEKQSRVGNYPSQLLDKFDFPIRIEKADLPNAYVEYREKQVASQETGTVTFNNTSLHLTNITNIKSEISKNNTLNISFQSTVLNKIPLKGNFKFFLGEKSGRFEAHGQTGSFDALAFNSIAIPMALVKIKSGHIHEITFDFKGNNNKASGPFVMKYENLKIDVLKKDEATDTIKKRGLVSVLANMAIKNDNPQNGDLRKATPEYDRNIYKSFFNLVWKTVYTGIKSTVGIP